MRHCQRLKERACHCVKNPQCATDYGDCRQKTPGTVHPCPHRRSTSKIRVPMGIPPRSVPRPRYASSESFQSPRPRAGRFAAELISLGFGPDERGRVDMALVFCPGPLPWALGTKVLGGGRLQRLRVPVRRVGFPQISHRWIPIRTRFARCRGVPNRVTGSATVPDIRFPVREAGTLPALRSVR